MLSRSEAIPVRVVPWALPLVALGAVARAESEAVMSSRIAISVSPNDLARVVDALCNGAPSAEGMVEVGF